MKKFLFLLFAVLSASPMFAQIAAVVELNKSSALSIFVETNMMNFSLVQKGDQMLRTPVALSANLQNNKLVVNHNTLVLDVKKFRSDNPIGQKEFFKLMQVDRFPTMCIELVRYEASSENKACGEAILNITITNVTRKYGFPVVVEKSNGLMRIVGKKQISITDFGLEAPKTLLFGLAKVNEQIVVDLNLLCSFRIKNEEMAQR